MKRSDSITKLAESLVHAQAEMPAAIMNSTNPFLKNRYADLGEVIESSRKVLEKHGLAISQFPFGNNREVGLTNILVHESGEYIEETVTMPVSEEKGVNIAQVIGRNITYLRRYSWASILGMVSEEDTDAEIRQANQEVDKKVEKIMKENRVWSIDAMEEVISYGGLASTHEEAAEILNVSVLPENAPLKTIQSWLKHFANAGGDTTMQCADVANNAYMKAKKGSK